MGRPNAFDGMMQEFCVGLGWCGSIKDGKRLHVSNFIPVAGPGSADDFVRWLLIADGFDPDQLKASEGSWVPQLKEVFVKHMGAEVTDAGNLRSDDRA